ncbi:MAG TPA: hypothetical protein VMN79_07925 [Casimicrobiaceae bacterium]|nr:hypothetical protein [Casimicrobiaceae bacterium]
MWWNMASELRSEFEDWHTHEHFPERLAIPGFLRGSRWTDAGNGQGVFVLYELEDFSVLSSPAYVARLNAPTRWSAAMMPHHREMVRAQSHVVASCGGVITRYVSTLRFSIEGTAEALVASLSRQLEGLSAEPGIVGAHLLRHETPGIETTTEQRIRGTPDKPGDWVLVICGYARDILQNRVDNVLADAPSSGFEAVGDGRWHLYTLSCSAIRSDVA